LASLSIAHRLDDFVVRKAAEISERTSIEMSLMVSFAVARIARFEFKNTGDIFAMKRYNE